MKHFVFRFECFMKQWVFSQVSRFSLELPVFIFDSMIQWRIFLTYLGTSSKWHDSLPFRKTPNRSPSFTHLRSRRNSPQNPTTSFPRLSDIAFDVVRFGLELKNPITFWWLKRWTCGDLHMMQSATPSELWKPICVVEIR